MIDSLILTNLPSDIIREIIKVADLDYFDVVRMISPQWNSIAFWRTKLPPIKEICIYCLSPTCYELDLLMPPVDTRHFGIPNWAIVDKLKSIDPICCLRTRSLMRDNSNSVRYVKYVEHVARRCSRIQKFKLDDSIYWIDDLSKIMGDVVVENADVLNLRSFGDRITTQVLDFVLAHSVQQLHLSFYQMDGLYGTNLPKFLRQAMDLNFAIVIDFPDNEEKWLTYSQAMVLEQIPTEKDRRRVEISLQKSSQTFHVRLSVAR